MMNSVCYWFPNNQVIASSRFFLFHSWWLTMWQIDLWLYDVWTSKHWHQVSFLFCLSKFCIDCRFFLWIIWLILMLQSEIWPVFLSMFVYVCINFRESKFKHQHWHFGKNNNKIISHPFVKTTTKTKTKTTTTITIKYKKKQQSMNKGARVNSAKFSPRVSSLLSLFN